MAVTNRSLAERLAYIGARLPTDLRSLGERRVAENSKLATESETIDATVAWAPCSQVADALASFKKAQKKRSEPNFWWEWEFVDNWLSAPGPAFAKEVERSLEARTADGCKAPEPGSRQRRVAVLLIDADYSKPATFRDDLVAERKAMAEVLARANATNTPVFEITVPRQYRTSPELAALSSTNWVKIEKRSESGFVDTSLAAQLKARGITDVILMGTNEQQCVLATAGDALNYGLAIHTSPQIVQRAYNDRGEGLPQEYRKYGEVKPTARQLDAFEMMK